MGYDHQVFVDPPQEFRGFPFWSWNGQLDEERLSEQLRCFQTMGLGGGMPHTRLGLQDAYLGERFMACIAHASRESAALGLLMPLYDEDQWPSGHAGGLVTCDPAYRQRECLILPDSEQPAPGGDAVGLPGPARRLVRWALRRAADGRLMSWRVLGPEETAEPQEDGWAAWSRHVPRSWGPGGFTKVDALSPAAMQRFVALTHERYRELLGEHFGKRVPFIFSDEPQIGHMGRFPANAATAGDAISIPWTDDLPQTWHEAFDDDLLVALPALLWDTVDGRSDRMRWSWFDHLGARFSATWTGIPAAWCAEHGLPMTGHMCAENALTSQILIDADIMRALAPMQYPGVDLLCDWWEPNTLKQASSLAHQYDRARVMTETYGVNRWDWPLIGHKRQADWQYALGANLRVPHLAWYSMAGAAKRDYPQPIDGHAPWHPAYRRIEDHFARLGYALTRGRPLIRIAVVHPLESAWLEMGPQAEHAATLVEREQRFAELSDWLIGGLLDFDFVAESLLEDLLGPVEDAAVTIGAMRYETLILPDLRSLRPVTLRACQALLAAGGQVLILGQTPRLLAGCTSDEPARLATTATVLPWDRQALFTALAERREIALAAACNGAFPWLVHQLRILPDGGRLCFLCNRSHEQQACDLPPSILRLRGQWDCTLLDTERGTQLPQAVRHVDGWTETRLALPVNGSVLFALQPSEACCTQLPACPVDTRTAVTLPQVAGFALDEPNVLLLDHGTWRLDEDPTWQTCTDILLLDRMLRERLQLPPSQAQPWCVPPEPPRHCLTLRCTITLTSDLSDLRLVCEQEPVALVIDGAAQAVTAAGWWVDQDLRCWTIGALSAGIHTIEITQRFGTHARLEWCYLLGDFTVDLRGCECRLGPAPERLVWGDLAPQGLPFYAGSVHYDCVIDHPGGELLLQVPRFAAHALAVAVQGDPCGFILEGRERFSCGVHAAGQLSLRLTALGSRCNAFGPLHNADPQHRMEAPHSWYTTGANFSRSYRIQAQGILDHPLLWL